MSQNTVDDSFMQCVTLNVTDRLTCETCLLSSASNGCDCQYSVCWFLMGSIIVLMTTLACICCYRKRKCLYCADKCFKAGGDNSPHHETQSSSSVPYAVLHDEISASSVTSPSSQNWFPNWRHVGRGCFVVDPNQATTNSRGLISIPYTAYAMQQSQQSNQPPQLAIIAASANGPPYPNINLQNPVQTGITAAGSRRYQSASLPTPLAASLAAPNAAPLSAPLATSLPAPLATSLPAPLSDSLPTSLPASTISVLTLESALDFPESEKDVNKMLIHTIRLSEADKARIGRVIDELNTCLTRHSKSVSIAKVIKSGSLAKGTATSGGGLDIDLVVFAKYLLLGGKGREDNGSGSGGGNCSGVGNGSGSGYGSGGGNGSGGRNGSGGENGSGNGSGSGSGETVVGVQAAESLVEADGVTGNLASASFSSDPLIIDLSSSKESFRRYRELFMKQLMWDFQECVKCDRSYRRECFFKPPFSFFTTIDGIPVDILGAFDLVNNCRHRMFSVNENVGVASSATSACSASPVDWDKLLQSLHGSEFNTSLVEMQKQFVKSKIGDFDRVKDLILLIKFWFKKVVVPQASNCRVPSYFFELVVIHHWETKLKRKTGFKLLPALKGVLLNLTMPEMMNIVWTINYSKEHVDRSLLVDFPLVLDPANPTNNVAKFAAPHIWHQLKAAAREALEETIMKG